MEYGVWPYSEPLFELPSEVGGKILECLSLQTSYRDRTLTLILDAIQSLGAAFQNR